MTKKKDPLKPVAGSAPKKDSITDGLLNKMIRQKNILFNESTYFKDEYMQQMPQPGGIHGNRTTNSQVHSSTTNSTGSPGQLSASALAAYYHAQQGALSAAQRAQQGASLNALYQQPWQIYGSGGSGGGSYGGGHAGSYGGGGGGSVNSYHRQMLAQMITDLEVVQTPVKKEGVRFGEIIAWRMWGIDKDNYLQSYSQNVRWIPNTPMRGKVPDHTHEGIWAFKDKEKAIKKMLDGGYRSESTVYGSIRMWGSIVEHEFGYRAENAEICSLDDIRIQVSATYDVATDSCRGAEHAQYTGRPMDLLNELRARYLNTGKDTKNAN